MNVIMRPLIIASCFVLIGGCAKKQIVKPVEPLQTSPVIEESTDETSVRFTDWGSVPEVKAIYFAYDSSELSEESRDQLAKNAQFLSVHTELSVLVEGNCDERGTTEYNLSLGQRRAAMVREYYGKLGIPLSQVGTLSYGEEKPLDEGHSETAWAKNRRADTKLRNK
jgi:peptidoglycan-associated lipoprotein